MMTLGVKALGDEIESRIDVGDRFAGLFATRPTQAVGFVGVAASAPITLSAHMATPGGIDTLEASLPPGAASPAGPAGPARLTGNPRGPGPAQARHRLRHVHDPARPGPLWGA